MIGSEEVQRMLVLCYGIQKSGSSLAFELVKGVLQTAGFEQPFLRNERFKAGVPVPKTARNYIERITTEKIAGLAAEIGAGRRIAVKTHGSFPNEMFPWLEDLQARRELQVIVSWRDPRDICLSLLDAGEKSRAIKSGAFTELVTLGDAAEFVRKRIASYRKWAALRGTLRLDYDTVAFAPDEAIDAIEKIFGTTCDRDAAKRHAFEDADTRFNKAQRDRHLSETTDAQKSDLEKAFRRFLRESGNDTAWREPFRARLLAQLT
jgi:hypothetical protein